MPTVSLHNQADISDELLKFAVIAAKYNGKWIFCRHKQRTTWEIPGGHRELGENVLNTAKRELLKKPVKRSLTSILYAFTELHGMMKLHMRNKREATKDKRERKACAIYISGRAC